MAEYRLTISSYNCKHFKDSGPKFDFMNNVVNTSDIILLQEHWLYKSHLYKLAALGDSMGMCGNSSMNELQPRIGRPYGGVAILWSPTLKANVKEIHCEHVRLCCVLIDMGKHSILIINAYMPYDNRVIDANHNEFIDVLNEMEQLMCRYKTDHTILGGDLNTDFNRNSPHSVALQGLINDYNMGICTEMDNVDVPYTYICEHSGVTSKIDHIIVSSSLCNKVIEGKIIQNFHSDHEVVQIVLDVPINHKCLSQSSDNVYDKAAWYKATDMDKHRYKQRLQDILSNIVYDKNALLCNDILCKDHHECISKLYCDILNACIEADNCIPRTSVANKNRLPGWNEYVAEHYNKAMLWHKRWLNEGRPIEGDTAEMRRITRAIYHKQIRMVKTQKDTIVKNRMAAAMYENRERDLQKEINKIRNTSKCKPISVNNVFDDQGINDIFKDEYKHLYNSVPYDKDEMEMITNRVNDQLNNEKCVDIKIDIGDVITGIKHLKTGKSDGAEGLMSDHIIHAPRLLSVLITIVFNAMLVHGMSPESMLVGTMVPIPKGKRQVICSSDKFRAITLSSIFCKVLDWVILIRENEKLCSSELQFGFKAGVSATHCTMSLKETVDYFNFNKTNAYVLMLDASKAFDRVEYCKLFKLLLRKKVSPLIVRLLIRMYTNQCLQVRWGNIISEQFTATNGVKQGGVLSPILFAIYMDTLLLRLKNSGMGCHIGNVFIGALAYADDVTLICPTLTSLKALINICELFANEYNVIFNGTKSKLLVFKGRECNLFNNICVYINGKRVICSLDADHLGHKIASNDNESAVKSAMCNFWRQYNLFIVEFGNLCGDMKCKLFKRYCCSFYGSPIWTLDSKGVESLCVAWRKALRRIWRVHPMTHKDTISALSDTMPLKLQLSKRFLTFYEKCLKLNNPVVECVIQVAKYNPDSSFGRNLKECGQLDVALRDWFAAESALCPTVHVVRELLGVQTGSGDVNVLSGDDVVEIIESLCVG